MVDVDLLTEPGRPVEKPVISQQKRCGIARVSHGSIGVFRLRLSSPSVPTPVTRVDCHQAHCLMPSSFSRAPHRLRVHGREIVDFWPSIPNHFVRRWRQNIGDAEDNLIVGEYENLFVFPT